MNFVDGARTPRGSARGCQTLLLGGNILDGNCSVWQRHLVVARGSQAGSGRWTYPRGRSRKHRAASWALRHASLREGRLVGADTRGASSGDPRHRCVGLSTSLTDIAWHSAEERTGRLSSSSGSLPNSSHRGQASRLAEQRRCRYGFGGYECEVCEKRFWWNTSNWHERFCKRAACAAASLSIH